VTEWCEVGGGRGAVLGQCSLLCWPVSTRRRRSFYIMGGGLSCLNQAGQAPSWRALPASTTSPGPSPLRQGRAPYREGGRNRLQSPSGCEPLVAAHRNMAGWGCTRGFRSLARQRLTWAGASPLGWNALRWCRLGFPTRGIPVRPLVPPPRHSSPPRFGGRLDPIAWSGRSRWVLPARAGAEPDGARAW
jgi:hypothetical protein